MYTVYNSIYIHLALYLLVWRLTKHWVYLLKVPFDNYVWPAESADNVDATILDIHSSLNIGNNPFDKTPQKIEISIIECISIDIIIGHDTIRYEKGFRRKHLLINSFIDEKSWKRSFDVRASLDEQNWEYSIGQCFPRSLHIFPSYNSNETLIHFLPPPFFLIPFHPRINRPRASFSFHRVSSW